MNESEVTFVDTLTLYRATERETVKRDKHKFNFHYVKQ